MNILLVEMDGGTIITKGRDLSQIVVQNWFLTKKYLPVG